MAQAYAMNTLAPGLFFRARNSSPLDVQRTGAHSAAVMTEFKVIVEKHLDGFVAYPLGVRGACVAEGETYEEALAGVKSALQFHIETFGRDAF